MSFNSYKLYRRTFWIFSLVCAFCYFLFHFNNILLFDGELSAYAALYDTLEYVRYALSDLLFFLLNTISALLLVPLLFASPAYKVYPTALLLSASLLFYNIPYYYIYHIAYGYDSIESITISVGFSAVVSLLSALYTLALAFISKRIFLRRGEFTEYPESSSYLSLADSTSLSVFSIALIHFSISLIRELVEAVTFFIEYADSYRIGELIYILGRFVFILLLLLISHGVCVLIHNKILSRRFSEDEITDKAV